MTLDKSLGLGFLSSGETPIFHEVLSPSPKKLLCLTLYLSLRAKMSSKYENDLKSVKG